MCTQPKGFLLTPDTSRMCLLRSLIFLCCFSLFILAAKVNVRLCEPLPFLIMCVFCGSDCRCGCDVFSGVWLALSAYVYVSLWVSVITHNCQAPQLTPCFMLRGLSWGRGIWWREWYFTWRSCRKTTGFTSNSFLHGRLTKNIDRTNTSVCTRLAVEMQSAFLSVISHQFHHHDDSAFYKFSLIQTLLWFDTPCLQLCLLYYTHY